MNLDMESQIHYLETEAYFSVLRAFKAQSDAITWDKEGLITNLRKELGVSDDEHREVLGRVNTDESIRRIREWRQAGGNLAIHDELQSPNFRKKQRTSHTVPALTIPPAVLHPHSITTDVQPSPSFRSQVRKSNQTNGKNQYGTPGTFVGHEAPAGGQELVGRKAFTRWPDDNKFYEAVITQYNPQDGRHHLVYDMGTPRETWEWVDLRQIPREDIRWVGDDPGLSYRFGDRRSTGPGGGAIPPPTRSRHRRDFQNGSSRTDIDDIEILHTETLIKEVEKVVVASNPDRFEIEKAKKMLKMEVNNTIDREVKGALADWCATVCRRALVGLLDMISEVCIKFIFWRIYSNNGILSLSPAVKFVMLASIIFPCVRSLAVVEVSVEICTRLLVEIDVTCL